MSRQQLAVTAIEGARCLLLLGDSITTDHISPAGSIAGDSPAADYLRAQGVAQRDFNSHGSRRGNHEVMMLGTFANVRLRNLLAPGAQGGWTTLQPSGERTTFFAAAQRYREDDTPCIVLAGREYGTGSSRDWAAKGPTLLGVRAVIAVSYERIHRSNVDTPQQFAYFQHGGILHYMLRQLAPPRGQVFRGPKSDRSDQHS